VVILERKTLSLTPRFGAAKMRFVGVANPG